MLVATEDSEKDECVFFSMRLIKKSLFACNWKKNIFQVNQNIIPAVEICGGFVDHLTEGSGLYVRLAIGDPAKDYRQGAETNADGQLRTSKHEIAIMFIKIQL